MIAIVLVAVCALPGCATVMSGRHQTVAIASEPPGAKVLVDGNPAGQTPLVTKLKRGQRHSILVRRDGYVDDTRMTDRAFNWWFMGNLLIGGLVGMATDFVTGAAYCVEPDSVQVRLLEAPQSKVSSPAASPESLPEGLAPSATPPGDDSPGKNVR